MIGVTAYFGKTDRASPATGDLDQAVHDFSKEKCNGKFPVAAVTDQTIAAYQVPLPKHPDISDRTSLRDHAGPQGAVPSYSGDGPQLQHVDQTTRRALAEHGERRTRV